MSAQPKAQPTEEPEVSETLVDEAVAACNGDLRATVRALLVGQMHMQERLRRSVSAGYVRRLPFARLDAIQGK